MCDQIQEFFLEYVTFKLAAEHMGHFVLLITIICLCLLDDTFLISNECIYEFIHIFTAFWHGIYGEVIHMHTLWGGYSYAYFKLRDKVTEGLLIQNICWISEFGTKCAGSHYLVVCASINEPPSSCLQLSIYILEVLIPTLTSSDTGLKQKLLWTDLLEKDWVIFFQHVRTHMEVGCREWPWNNMY